MSLCCCTSDCELSLQSIVALAAPQPCNLKPQPLSMATDSSGALKPRPKKASRSEAKVVVAAVCGVCGEADGDAVVCSVKVTVFLPVGVACINLATLAIIAIYVDLSRLTVLGLWAWVPPQLPRDLAVAGGSHGLSVARLLPVLPQQHPRVQGLCWHPAYARLATVLVRTVGCFFSFSLKLKFYFLLNNGGARL